LSADSASLATDQPIEAVLAAMRMAVSTASIG